MSEATHISAERMRRIRRHALELAAQFPEDPAEAAFLLAEIKRSLEFVGGAGGAPETEVGNG